ncbi:MAG: hypothetical protein AB8G22_08260 [Saprospiraceae bacterium]
MKPKELLGKKVADIKDKIGSYDSTNELLTSNGIIKLESGEIFEIPYRDSEKLTLVKSDKYGYDSIFNEDGFFKRFISRKKYKVEISRRNKNKMKGKKIIGIYQFEEAKDDDEWNELEERMIIELETGYLISEVGMSPFGTGGSSLYVFKSKEELESKYGQKLLKIF